MTVQRLIFHVMIFQNMHLNNKKLSRINMDLIEKKSLFFGKMIGSGLSHPWILTAALAT